MLGVQGNTLEKRGRRDVKECKNATVGEGRGGGV